MSGLSDALRLQTAQLNNFLIENYLASLKKENESEPQAYLFNSFFKLSEHLAKIGSLFGNLTNLSSGSLIPLSDAINEAVTVVFLIEKASGIDELTLSIKGLNTASLYNNINNIMVYGKEFGKEQSEVDAEIKELKLDNPGYFAANGTLKLESYVISFYDAIVYLGNHSSVLQVKNAFKKANDTYNYFSSITSGADNDNIKYTGDRVFIGHLLNTLTVLLIALGYIEPFFQKPNNVARLFEQHIKDISARQSSVLNDLS